MNDMNKIKYFSTKTYGHERGLSCAFRQPLALHSHCSLLHGYALSFSFKFVVSWFAIINVRARELN